MIGYEIGSIYGEIHGFKLGTEGLIKPGINEKNYLVSLIVSSDISRYIKIGG